MLQRTCHCIHVNVWNVRVSMFTSSFRAYALLCVCVLACGCGSSSHQFNWKTDVFSISFYFFRFRNSPMSVCWCCWRKTNRCLFQSPIEATSQTVDVIPFGKDFSCVLPTVNGSLVFLFGCRVCVCVGCVRIVNKNVEEKQKYKNKCFATIFDFFSHNWSSANAQAWSRKRKHKTNILAFCRRFYTEKRTEEKKQKLHSWINIFFPSICNHVIYWIKSDVVCVYHSNELIFIHNSFFDCRLVFVCVFFFLSSSSSAPPRECIRFFLRLWCRQINCGM